MALLFSCNNEGTTTGEAKDKTADASTKPNYPYTIDNPDNWDIGSTANTMTVLSALKAWEEGKMDESVGYFADTTNALFDAFDKKLSRDSLKAMFSEAWKNYKNVKVNMKDWESVIAKDKSEEWVTLWYTQSWDTNNGGRDSISMVNDLQLKNGKIIRLVEYSRKFH
jgi:hypothetical protein